MTTALTWKTSEPVSALYAAWVGWRRPEIVPALGAALARLREAFAEERVPAAAFWDHAFPALLSGHEDPRRLAEIVLIKSIGQLEAPRRVPRFERALRALRQAARPLVAAPNLAFLQGAWKRHGPALLTQIGTLTEPELLVEEATVVGVPPLQAGGGLAAAFGNQVIIEATEADSDPHLPEVIRLAWLLAQLQLDLPRHSEAIPAARRGAIAELALLPVALEAARRCRLTEAAPADLLSAAAGRWPASSAAPVDTLARWWQVYQTRRPPFRTALEALHHEWGAE
jgi:hypothetical protein